MHISDKPVVQQLVSLFKTHGIKHILFSPGSRNAPLVLGFANDDFFETHVVADERSAAYYAIGFFLATGKPAVVCCTSGSAAANYLPAITEAFYQEVPLIALTADRPEEWIDQGDGQTIRQHRLYEGHICYQATLKPDNGHPDVAWFNQRSINQALNTAQHLRPGPVHLNVPFHEPLYNTSNHTAAANPIQMLGTVASLGKNDKDILLQLVNQSHKPMILVGQMPPNAELPSLLQFLALQGWTVLTESTSNVHFEGAIGCIDNCVIPLDDKTFENYAPDLLITFGAAVVSKKIKALFRNAPIKHHVHVHPFGEFPDTYQKLSHACRARPTDVLAFLSQNTGKKQPAFAEGWQNLHRTKLLHQKEFLQKTAFCDLTVFDAVLKSIPKNYTLHLGNSTVVRYAQLFEHGRHVAHYCNRGTSGIDGSMSTATGFALASGSHVLHITGDISFFYDSNALFAEKLPAGLKVLLINNQGGGIFRYIPGPSGTPQLPRFFEAHHVHTAQGMAETFGTHYFSAASAEELSEGLKALYESQGPAILEVHTPRKDNDAILKAYFHAIK